MTQTSTASYERVADCVTGAIESGFLTKPPEGVLSGFSGQKLVALLQRLVADMADKEASCYCGDGVQFAANRQFGAAMANMYAIEARSGWRHENIANVVGKIDQLPTRCEFSQ